MPQTYIPHTQTTTELPANPGPTVGGPSNRSSHRPLPHSDSSQGPPTQAPPGPLFSVTSRELTI